MIRKITLGAIATAVFAIGILGTINLGADTNPDTAQNETKFVAFAAKPNTIQLEVDPDYGDTSSVDIDKVECTVSTEDETTTVEKCKASGTMNRMDLVDILENGAPDS